MFVYYHIKKTKNRMNIDNILLIDQGGLLANMCKVRICRVEC